MTYYQVISYRELPVRWYRISEPDCTYYKKRDLDNLRKNIEDEGIARQHGDTLEKRGISVDGLLNPSSVKDLKNIRYYGRIKPTIKQKFLEFGRPKQEEEEQGGTKFSEMPFERPGHEWDALLSNWIRQNGSPVIPSSPTLEEEVADRLISCVEQQHNLCFLDSKFPLFGFMRKVAKDQNKHLKLYLWQGEADAIAYRRNLDQYVIVDFKVVDDLLDYRRKKTDLCGKHLHQCLVYAKLLKLHLGLAYLPPSLIVAIDRFTGMDGYFPLFEDYPGQCYKKLDEYEWFTKQPPKRPLMIYNPEKLLNHICPISQNTPLQQLFSSNATVKDLLDLLGYDDIEIVPRKEQHQ